MSDMEHQLSYDDYKSRISMEEVLRDAGYHFYRRDGLRYPSFVRLDSSGRRVRGDKFIITTNGKCCFQPPQQKVYNIISFITEHPDYFEEYHAGINPHRLVNLVCSRLLNHPVTYKEKDIAELRHIARSFDIRNYDIIHFQKYNMESIKKFYPFFRSRMIDIPTQKAFAPYFMLAARKPFGHGSRSFRNLSFPLRIPGQDAIVGFEVRGKARLDGGSGYKGKALGSNASEGLWIASPGGTALRDARDVLWFESAFDAMAYYQLHIKDNKGLANSVFLSTGGNPTVMQFRGVINEARNARHHLCFDNDLAGKQFAMNFETELRHVRESIPKYGEDMKYYMSSLTDKGDYLSGNEELLPEDLRSLYERYEEETEKYLDMKHEGLVTGDDLQAQQAEADRLHEEYVGRLRDKLCIGYDQGRLKDLGTYDIPEWAVCAMENGDYEGLTDDERRMLDDFLGSHFPDGYVSHVNWHDYNEFNTLPAFGTRNENSVNAYGDFPFEAVKTYSVQFLHPTQREGYALPGITVVRELPDDGSKDWNDMLIRQQTGHTADKARDEGEAEQQTVSAGLDLDGDGEIEVSESEEKRLHHTIGR